jgi:hypothetical protein
VDEKREENIPLASIVNALTFLISSWPSGFCSSATVLLKKLECYVKRELTGMPFLYLPVKRPLTRGEQMAVPIPYFD